MQLVPSADKYCQKENPKSENLRANLEKGIAVTEKAQKHVDQIQIVIGE